MTIVDDHIDTLHVGMQSNVVCITSVAHYMYEILSIEYLTYGIGDHASFGSMFSVMPLP